MNLTLRPSRRALATLLAAGLLASPALAAHDPAPIRAATSYCSVFPEPLTFSGGQPVACSFNPLGNRVLLPAASGQISVQLPAGHLSALAACTRPGYGTMLLCPLWH